jgi:hypothetical protein
VASVSLAGDRPAPSGATSSRIRPLVFVLVASLLAALLWVPGAPAEADTACADVLPVSQIQPGDTGYGLTVSRGTTPEQFDVVVVDVLTNAIAPGIPIIIVEVDSPEISRVGGIWAGMSGSPVYIDGKLVGAIAYGFSLGPSKLGGVTPAEAMLQVPGRPPPPAPLEGTEIDLPVELQQLAREDGVPATQARSMRPLEIPVRMSGPTGEKFDKFADAFEARYPNTSVVRGASGTGTGAGASSIVPGGNLAVSLAFGDFNAVGVGTATAVCDGTVIGFGHPMMWVGATRLGMHGASAVRIVDDPTLTPYKLANAGPLAGTINQDRLTAVAGPLGTLPVTTAITSQITNTDDGRTVTGRTDSVYPDWISSAVILHGWTNYDSLVFDTWSFSGTSEVEWTINGVKADGSTWSVTRDNRHADDWDLSTESLIEPAIYSELLHNNPFEEVRLTSIDYEASAGSPYRALEIQRRGLQIETPDGEIVDVDREIFLEPGTTLRLRVPVREFRGPLQRVPIELEVPDDVFGFGQLLITGGGQSSWDIWECLFWPEECAQEPADSFEDLLEEIESGPRNDELTAYLYVYGDEWDGDNGDFEEEFASEPRAFNGEDGFSEGPVATASVQLDEVVKGETQLEVYIEEPFYNGCPVPPDMYFMDVNPDSVHAPAIGCAAALGITVGVSQDPPLFAPRQTVRRDQAASFIARTLDLGPAELPEAEPTGFTDIEGSVHQDAIERLYAAGIVRGRTATTFAPRLEVSRGQMATMLMEALRWATGDEYEADDEVFFWDVDGVHEDNINTAASIGLLQGYEDGSFRPKNATRRDQMATLLMRFYDYLNAVG